MTTSNYLVVIQQNSTPAIVIEAPIPDSFAFDVGATYEQMLPQGFTDNKVVNTIAALSGARLAVQAMSMQLWSGNTDSELSMELEFHTETDPVADVQTPIVNLLKLTMPTIDTKSGFLGSPGPYLDWSKASTVFGNSITNIANSAGSSLGAVLGGVASVASAAINTAEQAMGFGTTPTPSAMTESNSQVANGANIPSAQSFQQNPQMGTAAYWNTMIKNKITISIGNYLYFDSVVITRISQTYASNFDAQTGLPHNVRVAVSFKPLFMLSQQDLATLFVNPNGGSSSSNTIYGSSIPSSSNVAGGGSITSSNT
jgi:hypothetical protein